MSEQRSQLRLESLHRLGGHRELPFARTVYRERFGADLSAHFGSVVEILAQAGLVQLDAEALRLTPRGMFYADTATGLLAWERAETLREGAAGTHTGDILGTRTAVDFMG